MYDVQMINELLGCCGCMGPYNECIISKHFHKSGCKGLVYPYSLSNVAMNKLAYEGASLVPITVPDN